MARTKRIDAPGTWHHVMNRGARRQTVFIDHVDRQVFVDLLAELDDRFGVEVHLFCLVGNHFHLVVRSTEGEISAAMKFLSERFTRRSNDRHGHDGAVFRGRFHDVLVEDDDHHRWLFRYVHRNALDAGWRGDLARYPWSSMGSYLGLGGVARRWLRTDFYASVLEDVGSMRRLVERGDDPVTPSPELGSTEVRPVDSPDQRIARIAEAVTSTWGDRTRLDRPVPGRRNAARLAFALLSVDDAGCDPRSVADALGLGARASVRSLTHRARARVAADPAFASQVAALSRELELDPPHPRSA